MKPVSKCLDCLHWAAFTIYNTCETPNGNCPWCKKHRSCPGSRCFNCEEVNPGIGIWGFEANPEHRCCNCKHGLVGSDEVACKSCSLFSPEADSRQWSPKIEIAVDMPSKPRKDVF